MRPTFRLPPRNPLRYCDRCQAEIHGTAQDQPHLCPDLSKRLARRKRQVDAIIPVIVAAQERYVLHVEAVLSGDMADPRPYAEEIVAKLAHLGVEDD